MPLAAASSSVTAPLVTVSVDVAHLEQRIVAICGIELVEEAAEGLRFIELSVDVEELEEAEEMEDDGDDGLAIAGWMGIYVSVCWGGGAKPVLQCISLLFLSVFIECCEFRIAICFRRS